MPRLKASPSELPACLCCDPGVLPVCTPVCSWGALGKLPAQSCAILRTRHSTPDWPGPRTQFPFNRRSCCDFPTCPGPDQARARRCASHQTGALIGQELVGSQHARLSPLHQPLAERLFSSSMDASLLEARRTPLHWRIAWLSVQFFVNVPDYFLVGCLSQISTNPNPFVL